MARPTNKLSARSVATLKAPGWHADGAGLYLRIDSRGRRWVFVYHQGPKRREMGLGSPADVSLAAAREKAKAARERVLAGGDPIAERQKPAARIAPTFGEVADDVFAGMRFRNAKHKYQWEQSLTQHAADLRSLPVDQVRTDDVLQVLKPLWERIPETASRTRGRIERVLDAAKVRELRAGENPARWKGHLSLLLTARQRLTRGHHAAMPFAALPAFMADLRQRPAVAARAVEFTILTAARSGETLGATWAEIDREAKVWTVPAERMKAGREHRVPLSAPALAVLDKVRPILEVTSEIAPTGLIFPGQREGRPLSNMSMAMLMRRMGVGDYTPHGFRSSFRDWAGELTSFAREIAEAALAHAVGDQVELAYRRGDALEKRRRLMDAWATYLGEPTRGLDNVISIGDG